ncbi:hypothetical protein LOC68_17630 [Blastopirellula sp. JC732]|uniref:Uncharacterized protein n=1 Tax=Blastopirellula sediminis TaxID=2894196 RepID=A0A9X1MP28_9BACT|nr:hypothetical protein [Blastopirellula sediminis]MCC9606483.1 hypothetical protein [Blastopirellula sediminis]MCC9630219.1 hypothetical protein [Blastopirellula sediminis]
MDNATILFRVRWGIWLLTVAALVAGMVILVLAVQRTRRAAIISADKGRLYQISLAVSVTIDEGASPFADATPDDTWKRIVSRIGFLEQEEIIDLFAEPYDHTETRSDILAIRLPDDPLDDEPRYELICVEHASLFVPIEDPALLTADEFYQHSRQLLATDPAAARSFVVVQHEYPQSPQEMTLGEYVERLRPQTDQDRTRSSQTLR